MKKQIFQMLKGNIIPTQNIDGMKKCQQNFQKKDGFLIHKKENKFKENTFLEKEIQLIKDELKFSLGDVEPQI